jgi:hypothetical protein
MAQPHFESDGLPLHGRAVTNAHNFQVYQVALGHALDLVLDQALWQAEQTSKTYFACACCATQSDRRDISASPIRQNF